MAQHMRQLFPERSMKHAIGAELRSIRLEHKLSQARLGELIHHSGALVGKIEKAERLPTAEFCSLVDDALKTGGRLSRMRPATDPRIGGVPINLVVSAWNAQESLQLLRELTGQTARSREFVPLTRTNLETVIAGWRTAAPASVDNRSADTPSISIGRTALGVITTHLAGLRSLADALESTALRELVLAELRWLTGLMTSSAMSEAEYRQLWGLTGGTALLSGQLHRNKRRPGEAYSFYLLALRCAANAGDTNIEAEVLAEMGQDFPTV